MRGFQPLELTLTSHSDRANGYADVDVSVTFAAADGATVRRPAFWDGGRTWKVRFVPPTDEPRWNWCSHCSDPGDMGLHDQRGEVTAKPYGGAVPLLKHGLLRMSPGGRNVIQADGTPFFLVGDTAWSLPWRGTDQAVAAYAADRQRKGFNATLLMTVQPDRDARGPRDRVSPESFDVGFEDLADGHLNQMNVAYFQTMDRLITILLEHGIVPVHQPVFNGYGWKGLKALGNDADPVEYARFCRYLVARYGASPAIWLVSADSHGRAPSVEAGGRAVEEWDAYRQPTGIHYHPFDGSGLPMTGPADPDGHHNRVHQDASWLDFQWCQTGHGGQHDATKVSLMHDNKPTKAVANGEMTYEGIADPTRSAGWWQGNEAWTNICAGGTMGIVYGAAALWQWKLFSDEPGWPEWAIDRADWRMALDREGSRYVGNIAGAFAEYDFLEMTKQPQLAGGQPCVGIAGKLYVVYLPQSGKIRLSGLTRPLPVRWFNPKDATWTEAGQTSGSTCDVAAPDANPWVVFVGEQRAS